LALARVTFDLEKFEETRRHLEQLTGSDEYDSRARLLLAEVEYREKRGDRAIELLKQIKDRPDVPQFEVYKFLARIYLEREDAAGALEALERARDLDPGDLFVQYRLGFVYADTGRLQEAAEAFTSAIDANPSFASAHLALGSVLMHMGDREGAKRALRSSLALDPANRNALRDLSEMYFADREYEEGVQMLEPLFLDQKLDENGKLMLGRFYYALERSEDALRVFRGLMATFGETPQLLRVIAEIEIDRGNLRTAYGHLQRLVELEPDEFDNHVGMILLANGLAGDPSGPDEAVEVAENEGARRLQEAARTVDRASAGDNYLIGTVYRQSGDLERAEQYLLRAEALAPDDRRVLLELATVFERTQRFDDAIERIGALYEREPDDPRNANFYGYLLAEKGEQLDFASRLIERALEADPGNGYYLDSLGWVRYRQGDYREAVEILRSAADIVGDDAVIWEHLGDAYASLGMMAEAASSYSRSRELDPGRPRIEEKLRTAEAAVRRDRD
ncbi:MAG: tetratricopeptide repeat protein, partial [Candidatus Krumholzibacteria bacterium]|nr:tetratricopeptide repeat protein [Candidatus Krumholzibacteria bacterium]